MKSAITFPKIFGISIKIHWTFSLIIAWIIYLNLKSGQDINQVSWSVFFVLVLFLCVTLHEFGHALAAKQYGIKTKDITLYPIGGVARLEKMPEKPKQELIVAFAGPAVNVVITILLLPFILQYNLEKTSDEKALLIDSANFLPMVGIVNIWLALFNLIPAFPMDGGRVFRALLAMKTSRVKATDIAATTGKVIALGFIVAGFYANPFLIVIGVFIIIGAQGEAQLVKTEVYLHDLTAADALMTNFISLNKDQPISDAIKLLLDGVSKSFVIMHEQIPVGVIGRDEIIRGIKDFGETASVEKINNNKIITVQLTTPLTEVFTHFQQTRIPLVLVANGSQLSGIIDAENIAELILVLNARKSN